MNSIFGRFSMLFILPLVLVLASCSQPQQTDQPDSQDESIEESQQLGPGPLRFSNLSIRTEKYLTPAVSTGPLDPAWSPDGQWIAFSMRGDIWKVPAEGGTAIALTEGPHYYFEPDWSPDGQQLAFTVDLGVDTGYGIGVVNTDGTNEQHLVTEPGVNMEPKWNGDGSRLFLVSDRNGSLDIFSYSLDSNSVEPVVTGRGNQIQPSLSPDGSTLAYVSPVSGKPGSGGIWTKSLPDGEPQLVHYEETRHRAQPSWTPDGSALLYVTEITGSNDIGIIPKESGAPVWLTRHEMNELSPTISPGGSRLAFVSNRVGPTQLFTMPMGGGTEESWREVSIESYQAKQPTGQLQLTVLGPAGEPVPARIYLHASDGRAYAPDRGFHRVISAGERHYFHTDGNDVITVPAGDIAIEAAKGYEYEPILDTVSVSANETTTAILQLDRFYNPREQGWYSGETHAHDLHGGRFGLSHESFFKQLQGEDLHVTHSLIHMDGTRIMGRWGDLTGQPHPLSTQDHILQYGEEFRGSRGHIGMLGIGEYVMPFVGGEGGTGYGAEVLNTHYIDETVAQGGIAGFMHPYWSAVETPEDGAFSEIPMDVALGKGSFYDVLCIPYDALENADMYYRLLNSGFQLAATGGSDNFADVWRDPPAGTVRTYVNIGNKELSVNTWLEAVKAGHTYATNGPLLQFKVDSKMAGEEINLSGDQPETLQVEGQVASIAPLDRLEVLLNGEVVEQLNLQGQDMPASFGVPVTVKENGWIAVRAIGSYHKQVLDSYPFAQTTPVYVLRNGERYTSAEDARFLRDVVDAFWQSVDEADRWDSGEDRDQFRQTVMKAREVYSQIAEGAYQFDSE